MNVFTKPSRLGEATFWQLLAEAGPRGRAKLAPWVKNNEQEARQSIQYLLNHGYVTTDGELRSHETTFTFTGKEWEAPKQSVPVGGSASYF